MSRIVYFDLASGAGGDMLTASLAHAGEAHVASVVERAVADLGLGCKLAFHTVQRGGIAALHAEVTTGGESFSAETLRAAIRDTTAGDRAKQRALATIDLLVAAEARVHGVDEGDVHLHELGSADTAADAIGAAVAIEALGIESVAAAPVPIPRGWTSSHHGPLPIPAPATLEILRGARLEGVDATAELVTPTAAAVLVAHECDFRELPPMMLEAVGTGAGTAERSMPNVCRAFVGTAVATPVRERVVQLETNIDDQTPETLAHAAERLLEAGALDAWVTPIVMKKSRPAFQLSVLARAETEAELVDVLFRETTTLGVRRRETERWVADRAHITVEIDGHHIAVKVARVGGAVVSVSPEFGDCVRIASASGVPMKDVYARAAAEARRVLDI
jgi:uncharacterized protein (TIGR00299 family) protein